MHNNVEFSELLGKTLIHIHVTAYDIKFTCSDGSVYKMYHDQSCCEQVYIESIDGDIQRLLGQPILRAEVVTNEYYTPPENRSNELNLWTFYKLATNLDSVTIRWFGSSNGYYSVSVDFKRIKNPTPVAPPGAAIIDVSDILTFKYAGPRERLAHILNTNHIVEAHTIATATGCSLSEAKNVLRRLSQAGYNSTQWLKCPYCGGFLDETECKDDPYYCGECNQYRTYPRYEVSAEKPKDVKKVIVYPEIETEE